MDFQFTLYLGSVIAACSMEHEAVANWLNIEVRSNPQLISIALKHIADIRQSRSEAKEISLPGSEYSLFINYNAVTVKANNLVITSDDGTVPEENFHYYDQESISFCGLDDFEHFLISYQSFQD